MTLGPLPTVSGSHRTCGSSCCVRVLLPPLRRGLPGSTQSSASAFGRVSPQRCVVSTEAWRSWPGQGWLGDSTPSAGPWPGPWGRLPPAPLQLVCVWELHSLCPSFPGSGCSDTGHQERCIRRLPPQDVGRAFTKPPPCLESQTHLLGDRPCLCQFTGQELALWF